MKSSFPDRRWCLALALFTFALVPATRAADKPSVLFVGGLHWQNAARPLHELGIELDTCSAAELPARLASKKYNVVVPYVQHDPALKQPVEDFLAAGGGVFLTLPLGHISRVEQWFPNPEWAAGLGARIRWEQYTDTDPKNSFTDVMGAPLSWSDQVSPPVNDGVRGVLTLVGRIGWWPPLGIDFSDEWTVVVRHADSVKGSVPEHKIGPLLPYTPETTSEGGQALMGIRQLGAGRLAMVGVSAPWSFAGPQLCPTITTTMFKGENGKPSDWVRVHANAFRWLAEPSLKAGFGGAKTPEALLAPPVKKWDDHPPIDWVNIDPKVLPPMGNQPQLRGLIGARTALSGGTGTVADYARAAQAAGLDYLVFLEDSLKMDAAKFDQLVEGCQAASSEKFAAIPGLLLEDAQGNHLYTFGDNTKFPLPEMVLPDGRLATITVSRTEALFRYIIDYHRLRNVFGFWRHKENFLPVADYKLYNTFPVYSFEKGRPVDDAFEDYLYLMGWGGCQGVVALEIMTSPDQVAPRARDGWQVVATIDESFGDGTYVQTLPPGVEGLRKKWIGSLGWWPPYQYISNGPQILSWSCQNICTIPSGEWWRPDLWQYRVHLHVASEAGLKSVTIYDGDRGVFRRWLPDGAKDFTHDLVLANCQQRDLTLVVEDRAGKRAIGMEIWNRNTMLNQFICGDRCNFLGNARLRRPDGSGFWVGCGFRANMGISPSKGSMGENLWVEPAVGLTPGSPTLPIDGAPLSWPSPRVEINPSVPGEHRELFDSPTSYLISPEIAIGEGRYRLAYDPAEWGAAKTPLGHEYKEPEKQAHIGKNAWTSWYHLVPTKILDGWARITSFSAYDKVRFGQFDARLVMKQDVALEAGQGLPVLTAGGTWELFQGGQPQEQTEGVFGRGFAAVQMVPGGSVALIGTSHQLRYRLTPQALFVEHTPASSTLKKGDAVEIAVQWFGASAALNRDAILQTLRDFGIAEPGVPSYAPKLKRGQPLDSYLQWRVAAADGAIEATIPKTALETYIPAVVEGLNDRWSVFLVDRKRPTPNFRALPVRNGKAYAQVDCLHADTDLFLGHPVVADHQEVKLLVAWKQPGQWFVEAHNGSDQPIKSRLCANQGWDTFQMDEMVELAPGTSKTWIIKGQ